MARPDVQARQLVAHVRDRPKARQALRMTHGLFRAYLGAAARETTEVESLQARL